MAKVNKVSGSSNVNPLSIIALMLAFITILASVAIIVGA